MGSDWSIVSGEKLVGWWVTPWSWWNDAGATDAVDVSADNVASVEDDEDDEDEDGGGGSEDDATTVEDVAATGLEIVTVVENECDKDEEEESNPRLALWNLEWIKAVSSSPISISQKFRV